jgi:hypothetical protein
MMLILRNIIEIEHELILETDSEEEISSDSESHLDEHTVTAGDNSNVTGRQDNILSRPQHPWNSGGFHPFISFHSLSRLKIQEVPHVNKDSSPITVFFLSFVDVTQLLVAQTNKYYNQYLDPPDMMSGEHFHNMTVHMIMYSWLSYKSDMTSRTQ